MVATELITSESQTFAKKAGKPVLKLENVSKKYGQHLAVDDVTIEVYEGETIGIVQDNTSSVVLISLGVIGLFIAGILIIYNKKRKRE